MKTDRELLELAAKAAGLDVIPYTWNKGTGWDHEGFTLAGEGPEEWNPLEDDGDALRLAVKLDLAVTPYPIYEKPKHSVLVQLKNMDDSGFEVVVQTHSGDRFAATRRAIVRTAAAIGEAMP